MSRTRPSLAHRLRALGIPQALRLARVLVPSALGEAAGRAVDPWVGAARRGERRERRRARTAQRLARAFGDLKGPFAKAGQFAALRIDALPPVARQAFAALQDQAPARPAAEIVACLERELGAPLAERFAAFDPTPLGVASVAQVHRARLPGGEPVVVKVQFPWLAYSLPADLVCLRLLLRGVARRARTPHADRLFREFAASLEEELDFEREARVAEEIARNLAHDTQVRVPRVHRSHSTRRVLTLEHVPALRIDDRAGLARLGVDPVAVLAVLARAWAKQVFVDGLFHADPHPGNLFVVDEPGAAQRPRVLFVDFGLSRRLEPRLRRELRAGLHALIRQDLEAFLAGMERMGMIEAGAGESVRRGVAGMFGRLRLAGPALALSPTQVGMLQEEAKQALERTPGLQLPADLLLYARTVAWLFALGRSLAPELDLMRLILPQLLAFLAEREEGEAAALAPRPGSGC